MSDTGHNAQQALRDYANKIMRLMDEADALKEDIREVYGQAKAAGFDVKVLRKAITLARKDPEEVDEERALLDLYLDILRGRSPEHAELI